MAEYEEDVRMWSRLTSLKPENHAEAIVFVLGKQKHPIKDNDFDWKQDQKQQRWC